MENPPPAIPLRVTYFDGAVAYGGSLQVFSMLIAALDRSVVEPSLIAYVPHQQLTDKFKDEDIGLLLKPSLGYVERERWLKGLVGKPRLLHKLAAYVFSIASFCSGLPNQLRLFHHLYRQRPDLLHVNNSFTPLLIARWLGIPVVWHIHGVPYRPSLWERHLLAGVAKFIAISKYVAEKAVATGYPAERMTVLHNPAPHHGLPPTKTRMDIRAAFEIPKSHQLIAHVGRLVPWKGQLEFLQAFLVVVSQHSQVTALIVGDDAENFGSQYGLVLRNFVTNNQLRGHVKFTGHLNNISDVMAAVDIVVHSSIEPEPFGLVITEAMNSGAAVIASNIGAPLEIIQHSKTGLLVSPLDPEGLADDILLLLKDDILRKKIAFAGEEWVKKAHSLELYRSHQIEIYTHTMATKKPPNKNKRRLPI